MEHVAARPLVMPRGLIFLASIWFVGCWIVALGITPPIQVSSASYEPGVRMMLQSVVLGLMIAWPMLRLSQQHSASPIRQTWLDLVVLLTLMQVVVWTPRLLTTWPVVRTAAIVAMLSAWVILIGAIVAAAMGTERPGPRILAMFACVVLCLAGPVAMVLGLTQLIDVPWLATFGPMMSVRELTTGGSTAPTQMQWQLIGVTWIAATAAWVGLALMQLVRRA